MTPRPFHDETGQNPGFPPAQGSTFRGVGLEPGDERLLSYLSPDQRAILHAKGSYQEIAAGLQIPVGTVRSRLSRARSALMKLRAEQGDANRATDLDAGPLS
jgi:hypothetical protein